MGIMDMFRPAASAGAPVVPATPAGTATKDVIPGGTPPDPNANKPSNPMDSYAKMFDNASKADAAPVLQLDDKTLSGVTDSLDFTTALPSDLRARIESGDGKAMMEGLNLIARGAYKTSLQHSTALTDRFVEAREGHANKGFGSKVKNVMTSNELANTSNFEHPVVRQQLTEVANRLQTQNPDASPQQIATMAKQYLIDLAGAINPQQPLAGGSSGAPAPVNWDEYLK